MSADTDKRRRRFALLVLGALGIVYGDIGTNVLFALRAAFYGPHAVAATGPNVLGVLSLIFWALVLVLCVKYVGVVMRAENQGTGGILALLALLVPPGQDRSRRTEILVSIGLFGAALVYGDGIITPAISVLSAVEGLAVTEPALKRAVVPVTVVILVALFLVQHRGTGRLGTVFGPIMVVWFVSIAALGLGGILGQPAVLASLNPLLALRFLGENGAAGFVVLGAVVLTVAGAEALYADMGYFGAGPIRLGWYAIVFPALLLCYFGQGAVLLGDSGAVSHPFYALVPGPLRYLMVGLATIATVIASQALIAGAFALTRQAIQLGYLPRVTIRHTSSAIPGQIFVPEVNVALMVLCVMLVLSFRESSRLAAAYGMAVAGAMATTTVLFFFVTRKRWGWSLLRAGTMGIAFLVVDLAFVAANLGKIEHGAWIPLAVAVVVYAIISTWRRGLQRVARDLAPVSIDSLLRELAERPPARVPGVGVFLTAEPDTVPAELGHYLERCRALHERVVLLTVSTAETPRVPDGDRVTMRPLTQGLLQMTMRFGFMESPNVPRALALAEPWTLRLAPSDLTYFVGRVNLVSTGRRGWNRSRSGFFAFLWLMSRPQHVHLRIPVDQVVEVGMELELPDGRASP